MVIKEVFEKQGYKGLKNRIIISIIILFIALLIFFLFIFLVKPRECPDLACFQKSLSTCSRVSFIKEDSKARWNYVIYGSNDASSCKVKVSLLKMNQGTIDNEILEGTEMICLVVKTDTRSPEENIQHCSGLLKERLQEIIIEKMHSYLLKNLGEIKESFAP